MHGLVMAEEVNAQGWIAGEAGPKAELLAGEHHVDLPDLGGARQPITNIAYTISDDGRTLAGQADAPDGQPAAVVWHCR